MPPITLITLGIRESERSRAPVFDGGEVESGDVGDELGFVAHGRAAKVRKGKTSHTVKISSPSHLGFR